MTIEFVQCHVLDIAEHVAPGSVSCIISSPPHWGPRPEGSVEPTELVWETGETCAFGLEKSHFVYLRHTQQIVAELRKLLVPNGMLFWHLGGNRGRLIPEWLSVYIETTGWTVMPPAIWLRENGTAQPILRLCKGNKPMWDGAIGGRVDDVYTGPPPAYSHHDFGVLPVGLCQWLIYHGSRKGDLVLDPLAGSGTTGIAAASIGRDCILADVYYQDVQKERCKQWLGGEEDAQERGGRAEASALVVAE